jgi:hypothetical protein
MSLSSVALIPPFKGPETILKSQKLKLKKERKYKPKEKNQPTSPQDTVLIPVRISRLERELLKLKAGRTNTSLQDFCLNAILAKLNSREVDERK